jgi:predicted transposase YbfD/YdcC
MENKVIQNIEIECDMHYLGDFDMKSLMEHLEGIKDPRRDYLKEHKMGSIIFITMAAVICGAQSWYDIENYGKAKELWLKQWLELPNGIPSHDTFNRFFSALEPGELERCFLEWVKEVAKLTEGEVVSIDGKSIRGTAERNGKGFVHMVSAWASKNGLILGQVKVDDKSNEITAIPKLLELLVLNGCIVTIDAMGCQTEIASRKRGRLYIGRKRQSGPFGGGIAGHREHDPARQSVHTDREGTRTGRDSKFFCLL